MGIHGGLPRTSHSVCTRRAGSKAPDPIRKMGSINPLPSMAAGHRTSNPTRKRGSRGVILHCMSQRPQCLSHNPTCLSCCASRAMLGRVRTLPPLRFGLLADAPMAPPRDSPAVPVFERAAAPRVWNQGRSSVTEFQSAEEQRPEFQRTRWMTGMRLPQYNPKP